jgi:hypothetical protein
MLRQSFRNIICNVEHKDKIKTFRLTERFLSYCNCNFCKKRTGIALFFLCSRKPFIVPRRGLEPPWVAPLAPKASASTNFATPAYLYSCILFIIKIIKSVPRAGIEPARPCEHKILSLGCLPIPPPRQYIIIISIFYTKVLTRVFSQKIH